MMEVALACEVPLPLVVPTLLTFVLASQVGLIRRSNFSALRVTSSADGLLSPARSTRTCSGHFPENHSSAMNRFAAATARTPRSLCPAPATRKKRLGAWIKLYTRLPSVIGTIVSFSPCTTRTGAVTLLAHKSERNWSFIKSRTGTNQ